MDINKKDEIDTLIRLADSFWIEFDTRRSYEWKINFGLWISLATVSGFVIKENVQFNNYLVLIAILILVFVYSTIWTMGLYKANRINKDTAYKLRKEAAIKVNFKLPEKDEKDEKPFKINYDKLLNYWSQITQIVITILFLTLAYFALTGTFTKIQKDSNVEGKSTHNSVINNYAK